MDQSIQSYLKPELDEASKVLLRAAKLAHVNHPPKGMAAAYIGTRFIGAYISTETARLGIEEAMSGRASDAMSHAGRLPEDLHG